MDPHILALLSLYYQGIINHDQWIILDAYRKLYNLPSTRTDKGTSLPCTPISDV